MRAKTCPFCHERYQPTRPMQPCCDKFECKCSFAARHVEKQRQVRAKAERVAQAESRKVIKLQKEAIKTRSQWMKEAQVAFNAFIRLRDQLAGHTCISSGRVLDWSGNAVDAGHYRSVGSAPHLRFHEDNCHAQSKHDNQYKSGNAVDYRIGLIARIGLARVEALESDNEPRKYSIQELKDIKDYYNAKLKELKCSAK